MAPGSCSAFPCQGVSCTTDGYKLDHSWPCLPRAKGGRSGPRYHFLQLLSVIELPSEKLQVLILRTKELQILVPWQLELSLKWFVLVCKCQVLMLWIFLGHAGSGRLMCLFNCTLGPSARLEPPSLPCPARRRWGAKGALPELTVSLWQHFTSRCSLVPGGSVASARRPRTGGQSAVLCLRTPVQEPPD